MEREIRLVGSNPKSGKDSTSSVPPINKLRREGSFCKPHAFQLATSLSQPKTEIEFRLEGKPPSGKDSTLEQYRIVNCTRDGKSLSILSGNDLRLPQLSTKNYSSLGARHPAFGKDTNLGQYLICNNEAAKSCSCGSGIVKDSRFAQELRFKSQSFGNNSNGIDLIESQLCNHSFSRDE